MNTTEGSPRPIQEPLQGPPAPTGARPPVHRSRTNRMIAGVCGGLGESLDVDPVLLRIAFVALTLAGGSGVLLYIIGWVVLPEAGEERTPWTPPAIAASTAPLLVGTALVVLGGLLLLREVLPGVDQFFWPLVLVASGVFVLVRGERQ